MTTLYYAMAGLLLIQLLVGLARVLRGPTPPDRMACAQLFGTMGVAVLLLLAQATGVAALRDTALVFALLGALAAVAFVARVWPRPGQASAPPSEDEA
ncbi:hypothetical protein IMZ29_04515 [Achromobacter sp. GG226]|uniref:monovalent cation/H+ antiporter complex subunit F n=1 Tax=Verticiella alkaliphila TaxID=2779529 RepID=UPI001C0E7939|nr:monovalent cation/H+ antiporter complex subunit F [Verticiella sp. GG226]MBU4609834.1 hypothetical protein [Verticiella sp. GG226]